MRPRWSADPIHCRTDRAASCYTSRSAMRLRSRCRIGPSLKLQRRRHLPKGWRLSKEQGLPVPSPPRFPQFSFPWSSSWISLRESLSLQQALSSMPAWDQAMHFFRPQSWASELEWRTSPAAASELHSALVVASGLAARGRSVPAPQRAPRRVALESLLAQWLEAAAGLELSRPTRAERRWRSSQHLPRLPASRKYRSQRASSRFHSSARVRRARSRAPSPRLRRCAKSSSSVASPRATQLSSRSPPW